MRMFWSKKKSQENVAEQKELSEETKEELLQEPAEDSTDYYQEERGCRTERQTA